MKSSTLKTILEKSNVQLNDILRIHTICDINMDIKVKKMYKKLKF